MNSVTLRRFPPDDFFVIEKLEEIKDAYFFDNYCNEFYEIMWFTEVQEGDGQWINGEFFEIYPNQMILLPPRQILKMGRGAKKGYRLVFSFNFFHSIVSMPVEWFVKPFYFSTVVPQKTAEAIEIILQLVSKESKGDKNWKLLAAYFSAFFIHTQSLFPTQWMASSDKMISVLSLINQYYIQERNVSFYAKKMSLSVRRLNEISVSTFGLTVKQLIIEKLVAEAKKMIYIEPLSLKEIAYRLGFTDPAYFSRIFKKKTGYTPEEFRRRK